MRTDTGQVFRLEDYKPSDYLIRETHLTFRLDSHETHVVAVLSIERQAGVDRDAPLHLDGDGLVLETLLVNGKAVADHAIKAKLGG